MVVSLPFRMIWGSVVLSAAWLVDYACEVHRHDLLCYARATATALSSKIVEPLELLRQVEITVTQRLRHASNTWVKVAVMEIFVCMASAMLVSVGMLLDKADMSIFHVSYRIIVVSVLAAIIMQLGLPLSNVAEVFEYDVVKYLNNPVVLGGARRYIGDQTLPH